MHKPGDSSVAIIGLGKLGAPLLAVLSQHYDVTGIETNPETRAALERGEHLYYEAQVDALLTKHRKNYRLVYQVEEALASASVIFLVVPTPSNPDGQFDCSRIANVCKRIGQSASLKPYHLIVIVSTLMPTQMESEIIPAMQSSGKIMGEHFTLCYNPSFIALGSVVKNIILPDLVLIGECNGVAGERLEQIYRSLLLNSPPVLRMNFINAEIAKLALNTFVTTKISYANMIARLCEKLPGADSEMVLSSIGIDRRVGNACFKGAIGYGGPCFPRDNLALMAVAKKAGADVALVQSVHEFNKHQPEYIYGMIKPHILPADTIGMLGITYKPDTHSVEQSQAWTILKLFADERLNTGFYDPEALITDKAAYPERFSTAEECIENSTVIIIGTNWAEFDNMHDKLNLSTVRLVIDFWNILSPELLREGILLLPLGKGTL